MEKIYSKIEPHVLLHIVNRLEDVVHQRNDLVSTEEYLQVSSLLMAKGKTFKPHKHILKDPPANKVIAQESWVVILGKVKCVFYDLDNSVVAEPVLKAGDISITLRGGHNYEALEQNTIVYEYKTGPYYGQEKDKVFI